MSNYKTEIKVEVGYYDFYFNDLEEAAIFAKNAVDHIDECDRRRVSLSMDFIIGDDETNETE